MERKPDGGFIPFDTMEKIKERLIDCSGDADYFLQMEIADELLDVHNGERYRLITYEAVIRILKDELGLA